jgi:hypothetical protein
MGPSPRLFVPSNARLIFQCSDLKGIKGHGGAAECLVQGSNPSLSATSVFYPFSINRK